MTRIGTGFCVAAVLGCIATAGAQTPNPPQTSTDQRPAASDQAKDITITGCLAKSADGGYTLNNARMDNAMGDHASTTAGTSTTTGTSGTSATGTTAGSTTTGATAAGSPAASAASGMNAAATWVLSGNDLDKHVGHQIQVTGRAGSATAGSNAAGTTAGTTASGTSGTTSATGTSGTTSATGTSGTTSGTSSSDASRANAKRLDVQSVKMISASCS